MREAELGEFLARQLPQLRSVGEPQALSGGLLNFVWRVPAVPSSVVVKHAPPHVASNPDFELDPSRLLFEGAALRLLGPGGALGSVSSEEARPPRFLHLDAQRYVLVSEDLGQAPDLGEWLWSGAGEPAPVAQALGRFIGRLHASSFGRDDLAPQFQNEAVQRTRLQLQYRTVEEACQKAGLSDAEQLGPVAEALGQRFLRPGLCLIMGDLWPPSVLITSTGVRLIDWELCHFGRPAQDLGHLAAHLWMRAQRAPSGEIAMRCHEALTLFLRSYREALGSAQEQLLSEETRRDTGLHMGCEILARTSGAFQQGYLYEDLGPEAAVWRQAVSCATELLREPLGARSPFG